MLSKSTPVAVIGDRYGRLIITGIPERKPGIRLFVTVLCDCGVEKTVHFYDMWRGKISSCSCYRHEIASARMKKQRTHGLGKTPLYQVWNNMRDRCSNPSRSSYLNYGFRGIGVCEEWKDSFPNFYVWAISNGYATDLQIDRINNDAGYSPENCHWVTRQTNARNTQRTVFLSAFGETKSIPDWVEDIRCVVAYATLLARVRILGWGAEQALTTPAGPSGRRKHHHVA